MYIAAAMIFLGLLLAFSVEVVIIVAAVVFLLAGAAVLAEHRVRRRAEDAAALVASLQPPTWVNPPSRVITPDNPLWLIGRVPR